ncbi:MAG: hypothetical protein KBT82_03935 [Marinobacter sp.]|uniref:COG4705 family protein n=1 Tax=Marinobacter sp. TaxID=50741 RepID=UPI001B52CC49|nr:hypothetical protein [Marinobacter sp.]MBQ0747928.1 hypothetical protein [Marinobacter sp.]MBQ0813325.1 hypothetical protein [Marinobacter sp.]|tara:strand:+ start:30 stop:797 length:768 start_codon:yes stop_codon:yes gene_type:complete
MEAREEYVLNRVAGLTLFFWIVKILSTTVGETAADFVAVDLKVGLMGTTLLMGVITATAIFWNFRQKKYFAPAYWFLIVMMSIEGALITDILVDDFSVSLVALDFVFAVLMISGFYLWYRLEGTLSIHKITNNKREVFYWLIVLITFALGTGVGDTVSELINFGYANSLTLFGGIFLFSGVLFYAKVINATLAFWIAFIVTRPIGASLGDLLIQAPSDGGMGVGAGTINIVFFTIIVAIVAYLSISKTDVIGNTD